MKIRFVMGAFGLTLVMLAARAQVSAVPDAAAIQAATDRARDALQQDQTNLIVDAALALHEKLVQLPNSDGRIAPRLNLVVEMVTALRTRLSDDEYTQVLKDLNALAERDPRRSRNVAGWQAVQGLAQHYLEQDDPASANGVFRDAIAREEALVGSDDPLVQRARLGLALTLPELGKGDEALEMLEQALSAAVAFYGDDSAEATQVLTALASVHVILMNYSEAVARADEAAAIVRANFGALSSFTQVLGTIYMDASQLEKAREMYQLGESILRLPIDNPTLADVRLIAYQNLAYINARLGDGASARRYMAEANDIAYTTFQQSPSRIAETLVMEAKLFALAGMFDEARASLGRLEELAAARGPGADAAAGIDLAYEYLNARDFERARDLAAAAFEASADDEDALLLAVAGALADPPTSRLDLAETLLERAQRDRPNVTHHELRYAVAVNLAAEGRWQESAAMQKSIIDAKLNEGGSFFVTPLQWATYAAALEHLGQTEELSEVLAVIESERGPLRDALTGVTGREVLIEEHNAFGFRLTLDDPNWRRTSPASLDLPMAAFAVEYLKEAILAVAPVLLPEGVDARTVISAYMDIIHSDWDRLEPWTRGEFNGYTARSVDINDRTGLPLVHLSRVIVEPNAVYFITAGAPESRPDIVAAAEAALERVTIVPGATPRGLSTSERLFHGQILNYTGNVLYRFGLYADALDLYRAASEFHHAEFVTRNVANAQYMLGEFEGVIATLDEHFKNFEANAENAVALLWRGRSHQELGNLEMALRDYRAAFALGVSDDSYAAEYVNMLIESDRASEAADFLDEYAVDNDTLEVHTLQALAGYAVADAARVEAAIDILIDPKRSRPEGALVAGLIILDRDGVEQFAQLAEQLIADGLDGPELYLFWAAAEVQAGRPDRAKRAVEMGLKKYPEDFNLQDMAAALPSDVGV